MSYIINTTSGQVLTEIVDGDIDQTSTDLTLIGKNASTYGVFFNENFIHLLENFANISNPNHPIIGQLWYDTGEGRLKVYDGNGFKITSGTVVSNTVPDSLGQGDIWIDSLRRQMYFYDGTGLQLAGPEYTAQQGITGFDITDVTDSNGIKHTIVLLYVAQVLIGIFSKEKFRPQTPIDGFSSLDDPKELEIGFNSGTYAGIKFHTTATKAESLIDNSGAVRYAEDFVSTTTESVSLFGTVYFKNARPIVLGTSQSSEINVTPSLFELSSNTENQNFKITTIQSANPELGYSGGAKTNIFIDTANQFIGINTDEPTASLEVNGNTLIQGNLTVNGTTTTINSTNISVDDINIELGSTENPTNTTANGGGITLRGTTNKTLSWIESTNAWTSSEQFNLVSGKSYHINGVAVLNSTSLGSAITSAPGITQVGTLTTLNAGSLNISGVTISPTIDTSDIILAPTGSAVNVSNKRIINVADANLFESKHAVNVGVLNAKIQAIPLGLTFDITGIADPNIYIASSVLRTVFPVGEHATETTCRVFCTQDVGLPILKTFTIVDTGIKAWAWNSDSIV